MSSSSNLMSSTGMYSTIILHSFFTFLVLSSIVTIHSPSFIPMIFPSCTIATCSLELVYSNFLYVAFLGYISVLIFSG